jgi:cystathionine beta-lyase/cystathionine gamma-synthase
MIHRVPID